MSKKDKQEQLSAQPKKAKISLDGQYPGLNGISLTDEEIARFWSKVTRTADCWLWRGGFDSGQAHFSLSRSMQRNISRKQPACKVSYFLAYGVLTNSSTPLQHACKNARCVRPDHLYLTSGDSTSQIEHKDSSCQCSGKRCPRCKTVLCKGRFYRKPSGDYAPYCEQCTDLYNGKRNRAALYNIPDEEYQRLLRQQQGVCAICGKPPTVKSKVGKVKSLCVDHNHETGQVRALLCSACNFKVGLIEQAAWRKPYEEYLSGYSSEEINV